MVLTCSGLRAQEDFQESTPFDPCHALENKLLFKPLGQILVRLPQDGKRLPHDCSGPYFQNRSVGDRSRFETVSSFHWQSTNFFHSPAYFDNVPLERYGQTKWPRLEPVVSGLKFGLAAVTLPYRIGIDRPHDCVTTLGHMPPGDCLPCIKQRLPLEADAAFFEGAMAAALVFALP